ncbi:hypothetical protein [Azospirillum brasilense]|uniref:hypothetical protein n=1 Tax=Azospirillum brasilense TaxID=192 RepID=UPI001178667A|nr:hypothetical protein [Azospirillum brasilense]
MILYSLLLVSATFLTIIARPLGAQEKYPGGSQDSLEFKQFQGNETSNITSTLQSNKYRVDNDTPTFILPPLPDAPSPKVQSQFDPQNVIQRSTLEGTESAGDFAQNQPPVIVIVPRSKAGASGTPPNNVKLSEEYENDHSEKHDDNRSSTRGMKISEE